MGSAGIEYAFQCPRAACLHLFIGRYFGHYERGLSQYRLTLRSVAPYSPTAPTHPPEVGTLSPSFVEIHAQAAAAEAWSLDQISGCGYRKALEFLIKDYAVSLDNKNADTIKAKLLGQVIADHISDVNIQECARRATWLGNDETHYVRRWTERDIVDLKSLIALTESWINTHLLTQKYLREMPK